MTARVLAALLTAAPAAPRETKLEAGPVKLGLLPTLVHGSEAEEAAERLRTEVSTVLRPADFMVRKLEVPTSGEAGPYCADALCWQGLAREHEVTHLAQLEVTFEDPDWTLHAIIVDGDSGRVVGEVSSTCDLCGFDELTSAVADAAAGARRQLESSIVPAPVLAVRSTPAGANVEVDGEVVGRTPLETTLAPGEHDVRVRRSGFAAEFHRLAAVDGVRYDLSVPLRPVESGGTAAAPPNRAMVAAGAATLATGFALLGVGVVLTALHEQPIRSDCDGGNVDADGNCRFVHDTLTGGIVTLAIGGAAAVAGVTLLVLERRKRKRGRVRASRGGLAVAF